MTETPPPGRGGGGEPDGGRLVRGASATAGTGRTVEEAGDGLGGLRIKGKGALGHGPFPHVYIGGEPGEAKAPMRGG